MSLFTLVACDQTDKPVSGGTSEDVARVREARAIFDAHHGNWKEVPADDRGRFIALMGRERATSAWKSMVKSMPSEEQSSLADSARHEWEPSDEATIKNLVPVDDPIPLRSTDNRAQHVTPSGAAR